MSSDTGIQPSHHPEDSGPGSTNSSPSESQKLMWRVLVVIRVKIHDPEPELSVRAVLCQGGWLAKQAAVTARVMSHHGD